MTAKNSRFAPFVLLVTLCLIGAKSWALDAGLPPGSNFDLSHWYLGLPVDSLGGTSGVSASISAATLTNGYTSQWFYTGSDGAMTFWVWVVGATTSGSSYPRSELREQISPPDNSVNWYLNGTHILDAQCKVLQVPSSKKVIIGQLYNYSVGGPAVKIYYNNGAVYGTVKASSTNGASDTVFPSVSVGLSNNITYQIKEVNGLVSIAINNQTNSLNIFQTDPGYATKTMYFKAGDYCQDNAGPTNEGARVAFYALSRYHAPSITNQPVSQIVEVGSNVTFSVDALGNPSMTYAWQQNGVPIIDATNTTLELPNVQLTDTDNYSVIVSDITGSITSSVATLTVFFRSIGVSGNLDFGGVSVGASAQQTLTITNTSGLDLNISSISYPSGFSGAWSGSIPAFGSQDVTVTFAPIAVGSDGGTVTVNSDATLGTNTLTVTGIGLCTSTLSSTNVTMVAGSSGNSFAVHTANGCEWTAVSGADWIHTSSAGNGNGIVNYSTDGNGSASPRTGTITVAGRTYQVTQQGNITPQVSILPVSPITLPANSVNLVGVVTDDGAPNSLLNSVWSKASGLGNVAFGNPATANTTASFSTNGTYALQLIASDGFLSTSNNVTVIVNKRPEISSPLTVTNPVLQVGSLPIVLAGEPAVFTVGSFDADGNPMSCQWSFGDGSTSTEC